MASGVAFAKASLHTATLIAMPTLQLLNISQ
jgi:hypothetical protein